MRLRHGIATLLLVTAAAPLARADDVTDQIDQALKAYQNHDTTTAIAALDAAGNLLRQARADALKQPAAANAAGLDGRRCRNQRGGRGDARRRHHRQPRLP